MDNLRECPFCGGEAELINDDTTMYGFPAPNYTVRCVMETCIGNDIEPKYTDAEAAIEDWNRRRSPKLEPLTLEELRGVDGEPVWVEQINDARFRKLPRWCISEFYNVVDDDNVLLYECFRLTSGYGARVSDYGKTWLAYRTKPETEG